MRAVRVHLLVALACSVLPSAAQAAPPALDYACSPAPSDCVGWYRTPVTVSWDWDQLTVVANAGNCAPTTFAADTKETDSWCEVRDTSTQLKTRLTVPLHIDQTPPVVTGATDRPFDYNGWFTRPVGLTFQGSDKTSGVASCSSTTYGGPDGQGLMVAGSCRDVAGNIGSGALPLNYDATAPSPGAVEAVPGNRRVTLRWVAELGAEAEVARLRKGAGSAVVYRGPAGKFTDRKLRNGRRYRYRVTLIDQAGNRAADAASAVPTASRLLRPADGARIRRPPTLIWKPVRRARYYNAQLLRAGTKVLSRWPRTARLRLHRSWRFAGRRHRLIPGRYCWYVWPGLGARSEHRYGRRLGNSCFTVVR